MRSEDNQLDEAYPGGLIGIMTTLDPQYTMSNKLVGHILGEPGTLPPVYSHIEIDFNPIERYQHLLPGLKEFKNIELEIHCLCMETKDHHHVGGIETDTTPHEQGSPHRREE